MIIRSFGKKDMRQPEILQLFQPDEIAELVAQAVVGMGGWHIFRHGL
jgi:hypothetical protein